MVDVASVIMIGCSFNFAASTPLVNPQSAPVTKPRTRASTGGRAKLDQSKAVTMATRPAIGPCDRSKAPEIMTRVCPHAIIAIVDICFKTITRLNLPEGR